MSAGLTHAHEAHGDPQASRLNSLRAAVLGANDGIVSVAALILGMVGTGVGEGAIFAAGVAATIAGAVSMALGEYVSVSAQRDTEKMLVAKERWELENLPEQEHNELIRILADYGMSERTAARAAEEIGAGDALRAHLRLELGMDDEELTSPWSAAGWSALSFLLGAVLPLVSVFLAPADAAAVIVAGVTLVTLALTGAVSAWLSGTNRVRASLRLVVGGMIGLAVTYGVGALVGGAV